MSSRVLAIDGPSASGKSSTARAVAEALGFAHLDSGALYRGLTLVSSTEGFGPPAREFDPNAIILAAERRGLMLQFDGTGFGVYLDGQPVDEAIRLPEITAKVSAVSALPELREWVNARLRSLARAGQPVVVDGRDIGTVVFPDANLKVYLTASARTRAARRLAQRGEPADSETLARETALLAARDEADSARSVAPLRMARDAVPLDGTDLSFEQQVAKIVALARGRLQ
jgi:cytidylate kinase